MNAEPSAHTWASDLLRVPSLHPVVGAVILPPLTAALPRAILQVPNIDVFWKQQDLTLFRPRATVLGTRESWAPCSQEGLSLSLRVTSTEHLIIRLWFKLRRGDVVWWSLLGTWSKQHDRGPTNSVTGLQWLPRLSVWWLPLQGELRHFLKFLPRRITSE